MDILLMDAFRFETLVQRHTVGVRGVGSVGTIRDAMDVSMSSCWMTNKV